MLLKEPLKTEIPLQRGVVGNALLTQPNPEINLSSFYIFYYF